MTKEQTIDLSPPQNKILQKILRQQIPNKTVWAFGSRVEWKASETSDLDLVAHKCSGAEIADLKEALEESALHCSVDVLNWEDIPDSFRANIKKHYVVVQQNTVPEGWRVVKLGNIAHLVKNTWRVGDEKLPYVGLEHIDENGLRLNSIGISDSISSNKFRFAVGDTLFGKLRPYFRKVIKPKFEGICSTDIWVVRPKENVNKDYLFYFFANQELVDIASSSSMGTRMPRADWDFLSETTWKLPPPPEQKAIAEVLSSLEDKIDLLRKQNKTLEDMAQTLFRKCFVKDARDDWEKAKLSDEFDIIMGQSPPGHTYNRDSIGMPLFQGNADFQFRFPNDRVYTTAPHRTAQKFDTLVSVRAPVGKQNMARKECCIGRGVAAFRYKKDNTCHTYTYYKINSMLSEIKQYNNTGTVFGAIAKNDFASIYTTLPPDASIQSFEDMAKPIDEKILLNDNQVHTLEKLRDVLLPKLMSGKIRAKK